MTTPFDEEPHHRQRPGWIASFRASFLTGLVVIAPVGLTVWLIWSVIGWVDGVVLPFVPDSYHPEPLLNRLLGNESPLDPDWIRVNVRGVGVIVFFLFTLAVGWVAKGIIGRSMVRFAESLVERVPVVRTIYSGVKQIAETVFNQEDRSFEKACLVQYPRKGIWAIGFISTTARGEISKRAETSGRLMSVFLPTTPNPTSGFLLFVPEEDVIELEMSVEQAAKLVISAGLVYPNGQDPTRPPKT
ncbi:MAG: DUF502 domain-containing protein [Rhodobacteraceae bacterium]|nr:MAG: DUF502 domain-containing protein [Paracoccaceae bacterium]